MEQIKLPEINLLPQYKRQSPVTLFLYLVICLVVLALLGYLVFNYFETKSENELLESQIEQKKLELETLTSLGQTDSSEGASRVTLEEAVEIAEYFSLPTSEVIDDILERLPHHGYLSEYNLSEGIIEIKNEFETLNFVSAYVDSLLQSDYLADVRTGKVEEFDVADRINEADFIKYYKIIPRYQTVTELSLNRDEVKGEDEADE